MKALSAQEIADLKNGYWSGISAKDKDGNVVNREFYDWLQGLYKANQKYKGEVVVAKLFQLAPDLTLPNKPMSLKYKTVAREVCKVEIEYLIRMNASYWNCGKYYEIDEEATEKNRAERKKQNTARTEFAKKKVKANLAAVDALAAVEETKPTKVTPLYGVDKDYELIQDIDPEEKAEYLATGTEEECTQFISTEKPKKAAANTEKPKKVYGVDSELEIWENVLPEDIGNYKFTGSLKECRQYIKDNPKTV